MSSIEQFAKSAAAARIRGAAARGALSHAIILSGEGALRDAALYTACAMECTDAVRPCLACPSCRKVLGGIHPDVITVQDDEHKDISFDILRAARADAFILPNEGACKVYIFDDCARLTPRAQNLLLKVVEEGPPYAAFLFCTENVSALLQTIRSRCVELKLHAEDTPTAAPEERALAEEFAGALAARKSAQAVTFLVRLEGRKSDRQSLGRFLDEVRSLCAAALFSLYGRAPEGDGRQAALALARGLTKAQLIRTIDVLQTYRRQCEFNVGIGHALGGLAVELEGIL